VTALSLTEAASTDGDRIALISGDESLTFRALVARVELARGWLVSQGIEPGRPEPVAISMKNDLGAIELFWAARELGRRVLVLHPKQRFEIRAELVARTGAVELDAGSWTRASPTERRAPPAATGAGLIMPTSGTQGQPKLVCLSERALIASAAANWQNLGILAEERWLVCLPLAHIGGLSILTRCLMARRTAVLFDSEGGVLASLPALRRAIEEGVTLVSLVPTLLEALLAQDFRPPPALRAILLGGAAATPSLLERAWRARLPVLPTYGLSEAASQVTTRRYASRYDAPVLERGLVSSGHPLPGTSLRITAGGVIEIAGPTLLDGYWGEPPALGEDGWFRTGDRGTLLASGELVVLGRRDEVIVTGGENVDPQAIEGVLAALPGLRGSCVFGVDDPRWGQVVAAALAFDPGSEPSLSELRALFAETLAPHERPRLVALLPDLPLGPSGKLDRRRVKETARPRLLILER